jgi:ribosomal protein S18 acetylase RimI-like enzyme
MATTIHIREVHPSTEVQDEMGKIGLETFVNTPTLRLMFPRGKETHEQESRWRRQRFYDNLKKPGKRFALAFERTVSPNGTSKDTLVGYTQWATIPASVKTDEEKKKERVERWNSWPEEMDKEAAQKLQDALEMLDKQWLAGDDASNYWCESLFVVSSCLMNMSHNDLRVDLETLAVHPTHQRKGIGSKLAKWGIQEAAKEGKGVGLVATPQGQFLYTALGFKVFGEPFYILGEPQTAMRFDRPTNSVATSS